MTSDPTTVNDVGAGIAPVIVRPSRDEDVNAMLDIYRRHIARGVEPAFAHDPEALQPDDIKRRRRNMRKHRLPHLVADRGGVVVGYAYAVGFRKRPAYRYSVKHSIYVHPDHLHGGIGRALLPALIDACAAAGFRQMIGYIDAANALRSACTWPAAFARSVIFLQSPTSSGNGPI